MVKTGRHLKDLYNPQGLNVDSDAVRFITQKGIKFVNLHGRDDCYDQVLSYMENAFVNWSVNPNINTRGGTITGMELPNGHEIQLAPSQGCFSQWEKKPDDSDSDFETINLEIIKDRDEETEECTIALFDKKKKIFHCFFDIAHHCNDQYTEFIEQVVFPKFNLSPKRPRGRPRIRPIPAPTIRSLSRKMKSADSKRFIDLMMKKRSDSVNESQNKLDTKKNEILKMGEMIEVRDNKISELNEEIKNLKRKLKSASNDLKEIEEENKSIVVPTDDLRNTAETELKLLLENDEITKVEFDGDELTVETKPIILEYEGEKYNLGKFTITVDTDYEFDEDEEEDYSIENAISISSDNPSREGHCTPHANDGGGMGGGFICLGDYGMTMFMAYKSGSYSSLIGVILMYLKSYNPDDRLEDLEDGWEMV